MTLLQRYALRLGCLLLSSTAFSQGKPPLSLDEFMNTTEIRSAKISPDGTAAVIATTSPDWKANRFRSDLWLWTRSHRDASSTDALWPCERARVVSRWQVHRVCVRPLPVGAGGGLWAATTSRARTSRGASGCCPSAEERHFRSITRVWMCMRSPGRPMDHRSCFQRQNRSRRMPRRLKSKSGRM